LFFTLLFLSSYKNSSIKVFDPAPYIILHNSDRISDRYKDPVDPIRSNIGTNTKKLNQQNCKWPKKGGKGSFQEFAIVE